MPDVIETAQRYRQKLRAELAKLDEFLSYAERLVKEQDQEARPALAAGNVKEAADEAHASGSTSSSMTQSASADRGAASYAPGNGWSSSSFLQNGAPGAAPNGEKATG